MSLPFLGQLLMFAGTFAPRGWAFCDGQLLPIAQNEALFSLFGTTYGGDGRTTFGLPDLRGRIPIDQGKGPILTDRKLGQKGGTETVTISTNQLPSHTHPMHGTAEIGADPSPSGNALASTQVISPYFVEAQSENMAASVIKATGGGQSHTNLMPTLCINFVVATSGIYPSRS